MGRAGALTAGSRLQAAGSGLRGVLMRRSCLLIGLAVAGCGEAAEAPPPAPSGDLVFGAYGPLAGEAGRGSFRFGAAAAATQIEDQNPAVDWWVWTAPPPDGLGEHTFVGDASGGYTRAVEDAALVEELGLDSYRFSLEWARVEPAHDQIDEAALAHYDEVLDALVAKGIRPVLTVHHFSNPIWLDDPRDEACAAGPTPANLSGWDHDRAVQELADHARLLATRYGDRVDDWGTLNEPANYLLSAYGIGLFPPGKAHLLGDFEGGLVPTIRNFLAAHAAVYDAIHEADTVDADGDGIAATVGIPHAAQEWVPAFENEISRRPEDVAAVERLKWVYQYVLVEAIRQGRFDVDLDGTFDEEHPEWRGKLDWLGVQYYFRAGVTSDPPLMPVLELTPCYGDFDLGSCIPPVDGSFMVPTMGYEHHPAGLYGILSDFAGRWPDLPLVVTESGIATRSGTRRAEVIVRALEAIGRARSEGADVRGYYHWSLTDNFEWAEGFEPRFGLYTVDYATMARTPTEGATVLGEIARARRVTEARLASHGGEGPLSPEP